VIQTVSFDESDDISARELGKRLFNLLTRPTERSLAYGPGIPVYRAVRPEKVDLLAADKVVILPVLGKETHASKRKEVLNTLEMWHLNLGEGYVIPVPLAATWRGEEAELLGKNLLTQLYGKDDRDQRTVDEIIIAILRLFDPTGAKSRLFISHAKADLEVTQNAAESIRDYVARDSTAGTFFDANDLGAGKPLRKQISSALTSGVFVAIRSDSYSSRDWCLDELLTAKRNRLATLTVEVLASGEALSSPYGGNSPTLVWNKNPQTVVSRALVECLHAAHFQAEKQRIIDAAGLPDDTMDLCRPPELLDLAQGPIPREHTQVVLHPDPALPTAHRELLALAHPRLRLVTPTTAFRSFSGPLAAIRNPFDGKLIGFSISDSPDVDGPCGFAKEHIDDVAVYLARSLIATGAHLAYGGDFRLGGYTEIFSELISAYRQSAGDRDDILHSFLAAHVSLADASDNLPIEAHHMDRPPLKDETIVPAPGSIATNEIPVPGALYFSDMRRVMTDHLEARIVLGGSSRPGIQEINQKGYGGLYPGVIEEAWWSLRVEQPLYVIGGFGGAAGIVATLMDGAETPPEMNEDRWRQYPEFKDRVAPIRASSCLAKLKLPATMGEMAESVRGLSAKLLVDDASSIQWNGLSLEENRELRWTRDPLKIATLVYRGLRRYCRSQAKGKLEIELVEGTVTTAQELDAIAVTAFEEMPLGGAGASLDRLISRRASVAHASGQALVSMDSTEVAADYLYLASLGKFDDITNLPERIQRAATKTAEAAERLGFSRLGVVSFGGAIIGEEMAKVAEAMLSGLETLAGKSAVVWFENDPKRFGELEEILGKDSRVSMTTRRQMAPPTFIKAAAEELLFLSVTLTNETLTSTMMPPAGTGVARTIRVPFGRQKMLAYSRSGAGRGTPPEAELARRGLDLSKLLLGDDASDLIARCPKAKVMLLHDVGSSQFPFEILLAGSGAGEIRPAIDGGLNRRLAVPGVTTRQLFARPPHTGDLKILVVIDPLGDLPGAEKEGEAVVKILKELEGIETLELRGNEATKDAFLEAIAKADILHYCGHAFFDGTGPEESGLNLSGDALFFNDLIDAPSKLRVAFANACESGRVRTQRADDDEAASFAEYLLRTGLEAFLGTYWTVSDAAAEMFASVIYSALASGDSLDTAVRKGRHRLFEAPSPEWANYVLYGEGRFQIVKR